MKSAVGLFQIYFLDVYPISFQLSLRRNDTYRFQTLDFINLRAMDVFSEYLFKSGVYEGPYKIKNYHKIRRYA